MTTDQSCAICDGPATSTLHDGDRREAKVLLCAKCLRMLGRHPEERALLAIVHFGQPRALRRPVRPRLR